MSAHPGTLRLNNARAAFRDGLNQADGQSLRALDAATRATERTAERHARAVSFGELVESSTVLVDDLMNLRGDDPWSASFGFLVNLSLANLAAARDRGFAETESAMLLNLHALAAAVRERLVDARRPLLRWTAAIEALGPRPAAPARTQVDHPQGATLQRHFRVVRDDGLALSSMVEYYASKGASVYSIRTA